MTRKTEAITISCSPTEKASLEALAERYGCMWGDRPNISALIKAIANGIIPLGEPVLNAQLKAEIAQLEQQLKAKKKLIKQDIKGTKMARVKVTVKGRINRPSYTGFVDFSPENDVSIQESIAKELRKSSFQDGVSADEIIIHD